MARDALGLFLLLGQLCPPPFQLLLALLALSVLQRFRQSTQTVQNKAGKLTALVADLLSHIPAPAGCQPGNHNSYCAMRKERNAA